MVIIKFRIIKVALVIFIISILAFFVYNMFFNKGAMVYGFKDDSLATEESVSILSNSINNFSVELYKQITKNDKGNVFFSPISIEFAFAIAYEGAKGKTKEEMESVLKLPSNDTIRRSSFARIYNLLNKKGEYEIALANALWIKEGFPVKKEYIKVVERYYPADVYNTIDVNKINQWVKDRTRGKIDKLFGSLPSDTVFVITNAIYFKGKWKHKFEETRKDTFYISKEKKVTVDMMHVKETFRYYEDKNLQALELPYKGDEISMIVLLPKKIDGIYELEERLSSDYINKILNNMYSTEVIVYFPKFEFRTNYDLKKLLINMNMTCPFDPNCANFSGITSYPIFIYEAVHKAYVKVDEEGTEAAAATGIAMIESMASTHRPIIFKADHPFIFLIIDKRTGVILFMGRVVNPVT